MDETEERLSGGNVSDSVVRVGQTVRKTPTPATPAVDALLRHLHAVGFDGAPQSLGRDEKGRQVLEYIPGASCSVASLSLAELRRVGELIRELHGAVESFEAPTNAKWNVVMVPDGEDLICHNDLAPWNLIRGGDRWVFIDWDGAAPGTRLWDLAYAVVTFPPIEPGCNLVEAAKRVAAILDGYGLEKRCYGELIQLMVRRARAMFELLVLSSKTGTQPWARLYAEGHADYWGPTADYIEAHQAELADLIASIP